MSHGRAGGRRGWIACMMGLIGLAALGAPGTAGAAEGPPAEAEARAADDASEAEGSRRLLADQLAVMMSRALDGTGEPRLDQLERGRVLLELALAWRPGDAELWRLRAELAGHMDDPAARREALSRYVRLRPTDDAAQLALMHAHLEAEQTLDRRLERVAGILRSRQARQFSAPLRSRLASHAAELAHELGRSEARAHWLEQAVTLDSANPAAAAMAYQLALDGGAGVAALGRAAIRYAAAAPADAGARVELADVLLSQAVYDAAIEQYALAQRLTTRPLGADVYADRALALAATGDDNAALALLAQLVPEPAEGAEQHETAPSEADRTGMALELELLRAAILATAGSRREAAADRSYQRLQRRLRQRADAEAASEEAEPAHVARAVMDLAWVHLLLDRDVDVAAELLAEIEPTVAAAEAEGGELHRRLPRLRGWLALRRGEEETAQRILSDRLETDPFAMLGLARLTDDATRGGQLLIRAVHHSPGSLAGMLAARELRAAQRRVEPTDLGRSLSHTMAEHPGHLWRPALSVSPWARLELDIVGRQFEYLQPLSVTLRVRNDSRMPLPLADGRGVPTRVLLEVTPSLGGEPTARPAPLIVDVDRRLTLAPGESLSVNVRLDHGDLGAMLAQLPHRDVRLDIRAILGPVPMGDGSFMSAPAGETTTLPGIAVHGEPVADAVLDDWLGTLEGENEGDGEGASMGQQMRAVALLARLFEARPDALEDEARQRITDAVGRWAGADEPLRLAWVARFLPRDEQARAAFEAAVGRIEQSDEPTVRIMHLASHVTAADDPLLIASREHEEEAIRTFADALHRHLRIESDDERSP